MDKLPINILIKEEFKVDKFYNVDDIFRIFASHYNIELEEFKFLNRDKQQVSNILNKMHKDIGDCVLCIKKDNNKIVVNSVSIWNLFLKISDEIELSDKKVKITKEEYQKLINENNKRIAEIINSYKDKDGFLIDETDVTKILSAIFPQELGYYFYDGGKDNITNILQNKVVSRYNENNNKFIISKNNMLELIYKLYDFIELQKEKYYTISDVLERLKYPARLENYYLNEPWIYYDDNKWVNYDKTHIQKIIKKDYTGEKEFFKIGDWRIYGSDEEYKDSEGKYRITKFLKRPEGYSENPGVLKYLMNSTYCQYLISEIEQRKLANKYKYSLSDIEGKLNNISKDGVEQYAVEFLKELDRYYKTELKSLIKDNDIRIKYYLYIIDTIKKCRKWKLLPNIDKINELKKITLKLEKIQYKNQDLDNIINEIKELVQAVESKDEYVRKCARKLYNKQINVYNHISKVTEKSYKLQGEGNKITEKIKEEILKIKETLTEEQQNILEISFY